MIKNNGATPKTLDEAIMLGICVGPLGDTKNLLYMYIKDFLAQRFQVAMLYAEGDELQRLKDLFETIIRRDK